MNKKVLLKIYPYLNLGDDLFLKIILERYPDTDFYLIADNRYKNLQGDFSNLRILPNKSTFINRFLLKIAGYISNSFYKRVYKNILFDIYGKIINKVDAIVCIGGSMFIQPKVTSVDRNLMLYEFLTDEIHTSTIFFLGCNFGPFYNNSYLQSFKNIFQKAVDVSFREKKSYELFESLPQARCNPDIVFSMQIDRSEKILNSVGFVLVDPTKKINGFNDRENYILKCSNLIRHHDKRGDKIFLFSFCKDEGDEQILEEILNEAKDLNLSIIKYDGNMKKFLSVYSQMEMMYCGRFHALILSMLYNQRIVPIAYSQKMNNTLSDINFTGEVYDMQKYLESSIEEVIENGRLNSYNIQGVPERAKKHFEILDTYLGGN